MISVAVLLLATFLWGEKGASVPSRLVVGESQPLEFVCNPAEALRVDGVSVWTRDIEVEGATYLKLHLVDVNLRAGDRILVVAPYGRIVDEIEGRGPRSAGTFWSLSVFADSCRLEFRFDHQYDHLPFRVDRVMVGLQDVRDLLGAPRSICPPSDFEDAACYQDDPEKWETVLGSVGVMSVGGSPAQDLFCSGSNVSPLNYMLTNFHCIDSTSECQNSEFVFNSYYTTCQGSELSVPESYRCDEVVVSSPLGDCDPTLDSLDFTLSSVIGDPLGSWAFVRPDANPVASGEAIYIVQHPSGRPHEITHGSGEDVVVDGHVLRYYNTLDTEPGSSGSPIFRESDHKVVGLHHCGGCTTPADGNRGMLMADIYPLIEEYLCATEVDVRLQAPTDLTEVEGNGDAVLDPGETWSLLPRAINVACDDDAVNARVDLEAGAGSDGMVTLPNPLVSFGDIPATVRAVAGAPAVFQLEGSFLCGGQVVLDATNVTADNAGPFDPATGFFVHTVGELVKTTLFFEGFSNGIPGEWTVMDGGDNPDPPVAEQTWTVPPTENSDQVNLTDPFAICDSDGLGSGFNMDEELISPTIDCSGYTQVELQFEHHFNRFGPEHGDVDVRSDATGGAWVSVASFSGSDTQGVELVDISGHAVGQTDVEIRFHYYDADYEWWWAVDNVTVLGNNGFVCNAYDPAPTASMTGPMQVCHGMPVQFQDQSTGAVAWAWDFESDGVIDDTSQTPAAVTYPTSGVYTCTLEVSNSAGSDSSVWDVVVVGATSMVHGDGNDDQFADAADVAIIIAEVHDGDGSAVADRCGGIGTTEQVDVSSDGLIDGSDVVGLLDGLFTAAR